MILELTKPKTRFNLKTFLVDSISEQTRLVVLLNRLFQKLKFEKGLGNRPKVKANTK